MLVKTISKQNSTVTKAEFSIINIINMNTLHTEENEWKLIGA
jgi:hypothetical protein